MIITKEQQKKILAEYMKNHNTVECTGFVDGINATIKLIQDLHAMTNKDKISKIVAFQKNDNWHEFTCGNDSQHLPLIPKEVNGKVLLKCVECDYDQDYIPECALTTQ